MIKFRVIKKINKEDNEMVFFTNITCEDFEMAPEEIAYYNQKFSKKFKENVRPLFAETLTDGIIAQIDKRIQNCITLLKEEDERFENVELEILRIVE
jgi:hypothetical protein